MCSLDLVPTTLLYLCTDTNTYIEHNTNTDTSIPIRIWKNNIVQCNHKCRCDINTDMCPIQTRLIREVSVLHSFYLSHNFFFLSFSPFHFKFVLSLSLHAQKSYILYGFSISPYLIIYSNLFKYRTILLINSKF
jgi:hypothetical protein